MKQGKVWTFKTKRFEVYLEITRDRHYKYDGDDEDGTIQDRLKTGEYVAFDSKLAIELDGEEIAADYLGGSVYGSDNYMDFWTAHRDPDFMNRNCSLMREKRGSNVMVGHYFPGMVREAISNARKELARRKPLPYVRKS